MGGQEGSQPLFGAATSAAQPCGAGDVVTGCLWPAWDHPLGGSNPPRRGGIKPLAPQLWEGGKSGGGVNPGVLSRGWGAHAGSGPAVLFAAIKLSQVAGRGLTSQGLVLPYRTVFPAGGTPPLADITFLIAFLVALNPAARTPCLHQPRKPPAPGDTALGTSRWPQDWGPEPTSPLLLIPAKPLVPATLTTGGSLAPFYSWGN